MHIIKISVLMLLTENCQNYPMLVETTACQSWRFFSETHRRIKGQLLIKCLVAHATAGGISLSSSYM